MDKPIFDPVTYALLKKYAETVAKSVVETKTITPTEGHDLPSGSTTNVKRSSNIVSVSLDTGSNKITVSSATWYSLLILPADCKPSATVNIPIMYQKSGVTGVLCQNGQITTDGELRVFLNPAIASEVAYLSASGTYIV